MKRRAFIAGLGSAAAWPMVARAQQMAIPVVGFLSSLLSDDLTQILSTFRDSLASAGYIVGQNVVLETRFANRDNARLFALAEELVRLRPAVVVAAAAPAAMAMKRATASIPVVFTTGFEFLAHADPNIVQPFGVAGSIAPTTPHANGWDQVLRSQRVCRKGGEFDCSNRVHERRRSS